MPRLSDNSYKTRDRDVSFAPPNWADLHKTRCLPRVPDYDPLNPLNPLNLNAPQLVQATYARISLLCLCIKTFAFSFSLSLSLPLYVSFLKIVDFP